MKYRWDGIGNKGEMGDHRGTWDKVIKSCGLLKLRLDRVLKRKKHKEDVEHVRLALYILDGWKNWLWNGSNQR